MTWLATDHDHHDTDGLGREVSWYKAYFECFKDGRPWKTLSMTALRKRDVWRWARYLADTYSVVVKACIAADGPRIPGPIWRTFHPRG